MVFLTLKMDETQMVDKRHFQKTCPISREIIYFGNSSIKTSKTVLLKSTVFQTLDLCAIIYLNSMVTVFHLFNDIYDQFVLFSFSADNLSDSKLD